MNDAEAICAFWYAEGRDTYRPIWFQKNDAFDAEISDEMGDLGPSVSRGDRNDRGDRGDRRRGGRRR